MNESKSHPILRKILHHSLVLLGSGAMAMACFLVLPVMQAIAGSPTDLIELAQVDTTNLPPPPPPPPEEEQEEEPEPEEPKPELMEESQPLDLAQLEMALNPGGIGDGWLAGDFAIDLSNLVGKDGKVPDDIANWNELDEKPRAVYQPSPVMDGRIRKKAPGTVKVLFEVDQTGRVMNPTVRFSSDPVFERAALAAVKKWKFEPGKRNGKAVRFRMLAPITFPKR